MAKYLQDIPYFKPTDTFYNFYTQLSDITRSNFAIIDSKLNQLMPLLDQIGQMNAVLDRILGA